MGPGGGDTGFRVAWDGRVAIEHEVTVRSDAAGVDLGTDLGTGETGKEEGHDEGSPEDAMADRTCNRGAKSRRRRRKDRVTLDGHGYTSLLR
jgi:hypothetical protein